MPANHADWGQQQRRQGKQAKEKVHEYDLGLAAWFRNRHSMRRTPGSPLFWLPRESVPRFLGGTFAGAPRSGNGDPPHAEAWLARACVQRRSFSMTKPLLGLLVAGSMSLGACATTAQDQATLEGAGTGAALGAAAGAGIGAVVGGLSPIEGAAIGAAVGGLGGAIWADRNNDGYADGYVREGQYYEGRPAGYAETGARTCRSTLGGAATGAAVGAAGGAGVGAVVGGVSPLEGAIAGAVVGGLAGAIWTDRNNDGCVDGYVREGQYYEGAPTSYEPAPPMRRGGERG
jgi:hypothetical protein